MWERTMISAAVDTQGERFSKPAGGPTSLVDLPNTVRPIVSHNPNRKKVLFVTSEFADLVKTGGLGDVSAAPRHGALARCACADPRLPAGDGKRQPDPYHR